jgi:CheY-like chemotaxis protein/metal-responsive CopG/Arc/MetJ family transcriptional regulator
VEIISGNNQDKERISLYVSKDMKEEWQAFAKNQNYSTLSKLIREALRFFIQCKGLELSNLSHDLKEPLTSIKGYLQLIIETYGSSLDDKIITIIKNLLNQCMILEKKIVDHLDNFESDTELAEINQKTNYDILLIEDDQETVNLLTRYFESISISSKGVLSGFKGLKELKAYIPKVILLDIILPDINGYEVLKRIKTDNRLKNIPVFILTAIPNIEIEKNITKLGANGSISKPFDLTDFDVLYKYLKK